MEFHIEAIYIQSKQDIHANAPQLSPVLFIKTNENICKKLSTFSSMGSTSWIIRFTIRSAESRNGARIRTFGLVRP